MDMNKIANEIAFLLRAHAQNVNVIVREREIFIDGDAKQNSHDGDAPLRTFNKVEVTLKLR